MTTPPSNTNTSIRVITHGCRLNAAESGSIASMLREERPNALIVHNSCAVTNEAVRSLRQAIRRSAREEPGARIVVTGCAVHTDGATLAGLPEVDAVVPNFAKLDAKAYRAALDAPSTRRGMLPEQEEWAAGWQENRVRAFLPVQNGCDHSCTFCAIPDGRGASRSLALGETVDRVRRLFDEGVLEVVLTGVDLTSYDDGGRRLGDLVQAILRDVPALERLRLSSIDSIEADPALMDALGDERLMPHLHLSLQHGHDLILKRMLRRHSREDAIRFCSDARARRPDMTFGADLIAGFPTETNEHHAASRDLIEACGLTHLHVFPFSPRVGTPAARMPQLDRPIVTERAAELRAAGRGAKARHLRSRIGSLDRVVVHNGHDRTGRRTGLTGDFCTAIVPEAEPGSVLDVAITGVEGDRLMATHR